MQELTRFEWWMVNSNVKNLEEYGGLETAVLRLEAQGYPRVAAAVRRVVEIISSAPPTSASDAC